MLSESYTSEAMLRWRFSKIAEALGETLKEEEDQLTTLLDIIKGFGLSSDSDVVNYREKLEQEKENERKWTFTQPHLQSLKARFTDLDSNRDGHLSPEQTA